ncbi:MAG: hypothetical protein GTO45_20830 [Candidatus Aminicenantes bacterium]|nr:hypothetical protein [Candidatus Aminicenantes bacterium]NIN20608.1 hypothetical protein [Candidatus Aminicenantes bacterium]NIN44387.1 hypothetical protein [Candidatus Aminicenantes bacterium]NIN87206.1 hypothetical protein [Candidatus Aminicenantes bacterium]NIR08048.1 hypothetical protein [Candidatus Aminicenantes bacterium]
MVDLDSVISKFPEISIVEYPNGTVLLSKEDIGYRGDLIIVPVDVFLALLPVSERNV